MNITYLKPGQLSEGDTKVLNDGTRFVRRQGRVYEGGRCVGRVAAYGRPSYDWIRATQANLAGQLKTWAASPEGQKVLAETLAQSEAEARRLEQAQRVTPESLAFRVTI